MLGKKSQQSSKMGGKNSMRPQMGIKSNDLRHLLKKSYDKTPSDYGDYKVDKELSGQRAQVYKNDSTGKTIVAHRGTSGIHDVFTDAQYAFGNTDNARFDHAHKIQGQAETKYGKDNVITIGHSLGGLITNKVTNGQQITYNKPTIFDSRKTNELAIKTSNDPFSFNSNRENSKKIVIGNGFSLNPLYNHSTNNIGKLNNEFL